MDKVLAKRIASQQVRRFFYSYPLQWRTYQILAVETLLKDRFNIYPEILKKSKAMEDTSTIEGVIAQEVTNGLYFEGISIAIQSIEDLFALLNAGRRPLRFIGDIITYGAGKVKNMIGEKVSEQDIANLFYFPLFADKYDEEEQATFELSFGLLVSAIQDLKAFYNKYEFFYNQYKHGLCVVSRAYKDYDSEQIAKDKSNWQDRHLNVFDNLSVTKLDPKSIRLNKKVFMPYLTSEIQENLAELMKDDNLIRFVSQDSRITIAELVLIVRKSYTCASVFMRNIINTLNGEFPMNLYLPHSWEGNWIEIPFPEGLYKLAINKKIFM